VSAVGAKTDRGSENTICMTGTEACDSLCPEVVYY